MRIKLLTTFILCHFVCFCNSQNQYDIKWQNTLGGFDFDILNSIVTSPDGGYVLGGCSASNISVDKTEKCNGQLDYWVVKVDSLGIIQWQNTIGGSGSEEIASITPTSDGGYVLSGHSESNISGDKTENSNGQWDYWIVKIDSMGNILWQNTIGGSGVDNVLSIVSTPDGGFVVGGESWSNMSGDKSEDCLGGRDYWIVKIDSMGNIIWENTIGGSKDDLFSTIVFSADGGCLIGGTSDSNISGDKTEKSNGSYDIWILKMDGLGNILWQNTIGGSSGDGLSDISNTPDGGYILGGFSYSNISGDKTENSKGGADYWIIKIDSVGNFQWQKTIGGLSNDGLNKIASSPNGGYVLGGNSFSNISGDKTENSNGGVDYWVVQIDSMGAIGWQNTIGSMGNDNLRSIVRSSDGSYVLGSGSKSNISGDKTEMCYGKEDYWI